MKKYLWIICIVLFASCLTDVLDLGEETLDIPEPTRFTYVNFKNLGTYNVSAYSYYTRLPDYKVGDEIRAGALSSEVKWTGNVNTGVQFYLTYHLPLTTDYTLLYDPPTELAVVEELIMRYETNTVVIKALNMPGDRPLVNDSVYLIIKNNDVNSFRLMYVNGPLEPVGGRDPLVRGGTTGVYKIASGPASNYTLAVNLTDSPMPAEIGATFQSGYCYSLAFDGNTVSLAKPGSAALITLDNVNARVW